MDIVHGLSGHCPWTLSGQRPCTQWTLFMDLRSNTPAGQCPCTMSTESMDFLQTGIAGVACHTKMCASVIPFIPSLNNQNQLSILIISLYKFQIKLTLSVATDAILAFFNHPVAGKDLKFERTKLPFALLNHLLKVHGLSEHCPAGVLERRSMDNVHWVHGQCPLSPWSMSTQSMDNVQPVHGQCPLITWTMSACVEA